MRWGRELRESRVEVVAVVEARYKSVSKRGNRKSKEERLSKRVLFSKLTAHIYTMEWYTAIKNKLIE